MITLEQAKKGTRVKYIGTSTPSRIGKTGTIKQGCDVDMFLHFGIPVKWDDTDEVPEEIDYFNKENLELISYEIELDFNN